MSVLLQLAAQEPVITAALCGAALIVGLVLALERRAAFSAAESRRSLAHLVRP